MSDNSEAEHVIHKLSKVEQREIIRIDQMRQEWFQDIFNRLGLDPSTIADVVSSNGELILRLRK